MTTPMTNLQLAVVGAGPVGLALALHAARTLPAAQVTLFDARTAEQDVSGDPRTLALSLGSVQELERLGVWPAVAPASEAIAAVHVSQQQPALMGLAPEPEVLIRAIDEAVPQLGAVASYGAIVAPLQAAWLAAVEREPARLRSRFGAKVSALKPLADGVEVDAGIAERVDLAVIAEGGVFTDQARKALSHDYRQTAWVGQVGLAAPHGGCAYERFTTQGPAALLPLPRKDQDGDHRAALVWCVDSDDDPVRELNEAQRLVVLNSLFHERVGRLTSVSPLKAFPLGLNAERTLVQGRTVRIGNAAQTLHPVAGQGLNLGLRDAHELVNALRRATSVDAALRKVEWQRGPDRWTLIATTDFLARSFTWQLPGLTTARGLGLAALQHLGPVKSRLARQMMFGWR
jgi:2-octaprenyl-6-methoxyphenol hydroxylase